ncbi:MAG: hypothetical protein KDD40_03390, partial [Bdellovibrionales bacterium]|nr:hypothetical protein [Bdellovibrionales bacterium]
RIWDWRLKSTDSKLRNINLDGVSANPNYNNSGTCSTQLDGNKAFTITRTVNQTFLVYAVEIILDDIGDDDGLCESDEACIYSPNFGSYQGHGDFYQSSSCNITDGSVSNVKIYAYPNNGI